MGDDCVPLLRRAPTHSQAVAADYRGGMARGSPVLASLLLLLAGGGLAATLLSPGGAGGLRVGEPSPKPPPHPVTSLIPVDLPGPRVQRTPGLDARAFAAQQARRRAAELCQVCGEGFPPGSSFLSSRDTGEAWHPRCHESSPRCGLSARPIPPGVSCVVVEGERFLPSEYERAERCFVSGLPLANHGPHVVNPRDRRRVLSSQLVRSMRCVSCRDYALQGTNVGGVGFSCAACAASFEQEVAGREEALLAEVGGFLAEQGLRAPPVELFFATRLDDLSVIKRGRCLTTRWTSAGGRRYRHRILILSHLSKPVTLAILAHELCHAVQAEAEQPLPDADEEGFCELASWTYATQSGLPRYVSRGIEENQVDSYREGFLRLRARGLSLRELLGP